MRRLFSIALFSFALCACHEPTQTSAPAVGKEASASGFEGVVRIAPDPAPGPGKKFRGAWIEREDGARWVIEYEAESPFRELRDRRVRVEGETYAPEGQALIGTHFRVRSMQIVGKDEEAPLVRIGERRRFRGRFGAKTWPAGTKLEGTTMRTFVDDADRSYFIAHVTEKDLPIDVPVTLDAHEVEPSPYIARPGGPYLWIRSFEVDQ